ncbi:hypothetical protein QBC44DRAFT_397524 [Cladorrhinum sp. PSN332]|nr:hypothetical protein QBC44DRAFT_397524 [Cladorrhinum sp. PSN332]
MASRTPTMARLAILLGLLATIQPAMASFWTVTSYFVPTTSESVYPYGCTSTSSCQTYTYTYTSTVLPEVTPTAKPTSSYTSTQTYYDLEVVSMFLEPGSVPESELIDRSATTTGPYSEDYVVAVTYTAPSSCPTAFTVVTHTALYNLPSAVTAHLNPTSTAVSVYTRLRTSKEFTYMTKFVDPSALPATMVPVATEGFDYSYYIKNCRNPTATGAAYYGPSGYGYDSDSDDDSSSSSSRSKSKSSKCDDSYYGYSYRFYSTCDIQIWIIVVATVLPSLFVLGFLESFFWFRRLMCGKKALRLGTVCWCLMSLWVTCITRSQHGRTQEDQKELTAKWKAMPFGTKMKLWFKWGFRHKYPVELLGAYPSAQVQVVTVMVDQNGHPINGQQAQPGQAAAGEKGVQSVPSTAVSDATAVPAPPPAAHVAGQTPAPANAGVQPASGEQQQQQQQAPK